MSASKIMAMAALAAFAAGCRRDGALSDLQAKWDPTINMPVASFGQELTDGNMPPHLILLEASITDEEGKPRKVPRFSVNGTAVETEGLAEDSSEGNSQSLECAGVSVMAAIKHDPAAYKDSVIAIRADAGCKHEIVATLVNAAHTAGFMKVLLLSSKDGASEGSPELLSFEIIRSCPCSGWLHKDDEFLYGDEEEFDDDFLAEIEPPPGMEPRMERDGSAVAHEAPVPRKKEKVEKLPTPAMKMRLDIGPYTDAIIQGGRGVTLDVLNARFEEQAKDSELSGKGVFISCSMDSKHKTLVEVLSILYKHGFKRYYLFSM